jgi:hypothetical protein
MVLMAKNIPAAIGSLVVFILIDLEIAKFYTKIQEKTIAIHPLKPVQCQ